MYYPRTKERAISLIEEKLKESGIEPTFCYSLIVKLSGHYKVTNGFETWVSDDGQNLRCFFDTGAVIADSQGHYAITRW